MEGVVHQEAPATVEIPVGESPGAEWRVMRGGSFWFDADWARAAYRSGGIPDFGKDDMGFRVVLPETRFLRSG